MDLVENGNIDIFVKRHPWELARYAIIREKVRKMLATIPEGVKPVLVDIGCGDAYVGTKNYTMNLFHVGMIILPIQVFLPSISILHRRISKP